MGRTSKFSFPVPGRKHTATSRETEKASTRPPIPNGLSKAQRILGAESDLNIDSPNRDDDDGLSWRYPSSRSSDMSISISESTRSIQSTNDTGSLHGSVSEQWDHELGVFQRSRLPGKASSTLLGQTYGEDAITDTSSVGRQMRREDSSSTLRSYYDRQKSPLAISQQTSASSARDLALRKGYPSVVSSLPRSPLLQVESSDIFEEQFVNGLHNEGGLSRDRSTKKKPSRLDLSSLFSSRSKRSSKIPNGALQISGPSSLYSDAPIAESQSLQGPRKLTKAQSKESLRSQQPSFRSTKSHDPRQFRQSNNTLSNLYDSYEELALSSPMRQIPESREPDPEPKRHNDRRAVVPRRDKDSRERSVIASQPERRTNSRENQNHPNNDSHARRRIDSYAQPRQLHAKDQEPWTPPDKEPFSWKHVRESLISPPWDSSAASISSRNTKTSRHTSASAFSNSDLKQSSVLSLSDSNSDGDTSDREPMRSPAKSSNDKASRILHGGPHRSVETRRQSSQPLEKVAPKKQSSRKFASQPSPFLTIPEATVTSSRLSGPWSPPTLDNSKSVETMRSVDKRERRSMKAQSTSSKRASNQPTPPLSPQSDIVRDAERDSGRFMAVTKQEEALLEALRQKRARMREKIIEEHETQKSPPRAVNRKTSRHSESSSVNTIRGLENPSGKHRILLYLNTPVNDGHVIDTAEPSPDLSDFLSFGSDEDSTPRTSWAPPRRGQGRPDSSVSPEPRSQKFSPATPPSVARLSAVGASTFRNVRSSDPSLVAKKRNTNVGVRFVDDAKLGHPQDFLLDENEEGDIWGMPSNEDGI